MAAWEETRCVSREECRARMAKRTERARVRGMKLVLKEPLAPGAPRGTCLWCGERIVLLPGAPAGCGSRETHRGDEREEGDRDCRTEYWRSYAYDARTALEFRGDPECVDCGREDGPWDADHEVPLEDGGEHSLENLRRRCKDCHAAKTGREARERAARRRAGA